MPLHTILAGAGVVWMSKKETVRPTTALTKELRKIDKVLGLPSILSLFRNKFRRVHVVYIQFQRRIEKQVHLFVNEIKATVRGETAKRLQYLLIRCSLETFRWCAQIYI